MVGTPVGVPVARQVERQRRPVEGQEHGVPGVGVLGPTVQQHDLGIARPPAQAAQPPVAVHRHRDPLDGGRAVHARPASAAFSANSPNSS